MSHSLEPQLINENNWYYEERRGVALVHEVPGGVDYVLIPWRMLVATMKRHRRKRREKQ